MTTTSGLIPNEASYEGRKLGRHLSRLCDAEIAGKPDNRCGTCAFRSGDHVANGSVSTLMTAFKCVMEREPFWCHEHDRPCAGWLALRVPEGEQISMPWEASEGHD